MAVFHIILRHNLVNLVEESVLDFKLGSFVFRYTSNKIDMHNSILFLIIIYFCPFIIPINISDKIKQCIATHT
jgi:hypothetical protein